MSQQQQPKTSEEESEFEQLNAAPQLSLAREFLLFLRENKKWWLAPILIVLFASGVLIALVSSGAVPPIYLFF